MTDLDSFGPLPAQTSRPRPTDEQLQALQLFSGDNSMVIEAGAGTGKTTTLKLLGSSTQKRGQYLAFNNAIVKDSSAKMPSNVQCNTAHSLAFRAVGYHYKARLDAPRQRGSELAAILKVQGQSFEHRHLTAPYLAGLVMRGIDQFCRTADAEPGRRHVPAVLNLENEENARLAEYLEPFVQKAWTDLRTTEGRLRFTHDCYLKLYQLSGPRIEVDFVLFDEAQDANPVMSAIVGAQRHAQLVFVGDSQQQIYSFTGAVNALAGFAGERIYLTQSFRFGNAIAEVANVLLERLQAPLRLRGLDSLASIVYPAEHPKAVLTRTNAGAVSRLLLLQQRGHAVHLVEEGKVIRSFSQAAQDLKKGRRTDHPELACFASWGEVEEYVEKDQRGGDLALLVRLIRDFGISTILTALDKIVPETEAHTTISTAHKSKGREWDTVQLAGDFVRKNRDGEIIQPEPEELRLLYVACTRARLHLDIEAVSPLIYPED